jgi:hypothetical protein
MKTRSRWMTTTAKVCSVNDNDKLDKQNDDVEIANHTSTEQRPSTQTMKPLSPSTTALVDNLRHRTRITQHALVMCVYCKYF